MNVIIIDDDRLVSSALKTILENDEEISVPDLGSDGSDALPLFRKWKPDVLLMDIRMGTVSGLEAAQEILTEFPTAKILLLTTFSDDEYIIKALHIGAKGYLLKQDYESIAPAIKAVYSGQTVFGTEIIEKIPHLLHSSDSFDYQALNISEREYRLITLVAKGLSNREISEALFLSEGTVRNYLSGILDKLELRDRTQLAVFYYQHKGSA